jgi:cytoskeletal protein CcmA (bactofilin family)
MKIPHAFCCIAFALARLSFAADPTPPATSTSATETIGAEAPIAPKTVADGGAVGDIQAASENIEVGKNASAGNLTTVSGAVLIGPGSSVMSITTQIGTVNLAAGAMVVKDVSIEAGSVTIGKGAIVMGRIIVVRPPKGIKPSLKIVIEEGAAVQGGVFMGYPVQICVAINASAGRVSGGKALKCKA